MAEVTKSEQFSFVEAEHQILKFWEEQGIFQKSLQQSAAADPYIFYDGPPFATGLPHFGHLVGSTLKDIIPRYHTMKGFHVERRFGWDCHGLPVEYEIDKKLGMSAQDAVAKLGVAAYNNECRSIVQRYTEEWRKTITRIGRWVDFDNDYKTMDTPFMESVWWVFQQLWDKGLIYQGAKVVPYSTALGTVLSNFEAGQNYQDVQDPAITVLFKVKGEDYSIAAWTTTPWTLPANLGLCVKADLDYIKVKDTETNQVFVMAEARLEHYQKRHPLEVLATFKGESLVGKRYEPLLPFFAELAEQGAFQIFADDYVTTESGSGIVHLAPAFGEDDNRIFREAKLDVIVCPIDEAGRFTEDVTEYAGVYVKDADKAIARRLKDEGKLYEHDTIVHSYPFCWRSDTPLIYRTIPTWYVAVEKIKENLLKSNQQINWVPEHIKEGRFGKWLEGARDWAISRNRVWGTPIPVWMNDETGNTHCIGSVSELEELSGQTIDDLHREFVDDLTFTKAGEAGTYRRIPEVLDCWFESGSMPYAQLHYPFENKEVFEKGFPAAFIAEGLDQTRGWFYTLTVLATALYEKPAFCNVIVNGIVNAEDGKKMSKRLKNYTEPDTLMEKFGADALRLYMINSPLVRAEELRFSDTGVKEMVRRVLLPWHNAFKFFETYASIDEWKPSEHLQFGENITDRWILSRLQTLIRRVNEEMAEYQLYNVLPALFDFIEDLTNWYIRLNRRRFWADGLAADKQQAYSTLYTTVKTISMLMAPFAPFLSEHIFQELRRFGEMDAESVHLCRYPEANEQSIDLRLEDSVDRMQQVILLGRQKRNQVQIKIKTPLKQLTIIHQDQDRLDDIAKLESYIKTELNIKDIAYSQAEQDYIRLFAKPNAPILGKRLGKAFKAYQQKIQALSTAQLQNLEEQGSLKIDEQSFSSEEIVVFREALVGTNAVSNRWITIDLDCTLDQDLLDEGYAREVVNRIQRYRKEQDFEVADRIHVQYSGDDQFIQAIQKHQDYIATETLATQFDHVSELSEGQDFEIEGKLVKLAIKRTAA